MISSTERYFTALNHLDRESYLNCFSGDAEVIDPYGSPVFRGRENIAKWFSGMEKTWSTFMMQPLNQFVSGDRIAVAWQAEGKSKSGKSANFEGINIFTVSSEGLITRLEGYWDFDDLMAQIN